tara:strand:+ start:856 stop:1023 length:168 start_codon:yes stop_codon:yes gene_type:complete
MLIEVLLSTALTCQEADALMLRIERHENLPDMVKVELVETVKDSTNSECMWDAND